MRAAGGRDRGAGSNRRRSHWKPAPGFLWEDLANQITRQDGVGSIVEAQRSAAVANAFKFERTRFAVKFPLPVGNEAESMR